MPTWWAEMCARQRDSVTGATEPGEEKRKKIPKGKDMLTEDTSRSLSGQTDADEPAAGPEAGGHRRGRRSGRVGRARSSGREVRLGRFWNAASAAGRRGGGAGARRPLYSARLLSNRRSARRSQGMTPIDLTWPHSQLSSSSAPQ